MKRLYVWFDAVIGYLSASVEWARRGRRPGRVAAVVDAIRTPAATTSWARTTSSSTRVIWPAHAARPQRRRATTAATPGRSATLNLPDEIVSSEFLTMSGSKFSTSRGTVIYVGDFLREFGPDALRYFIAVAGPETPGHRLHLGRVRPPHQLRAGQRVGQPGQPVDLDGAQERRRDPDAGDAARRRRRAAGASRGRRSTRSATLLGAQPVQAAIGEAMRVVGAANKYMSDQEPWKLQGRPGPARHRPAHRAAGGRRTPTRCSRRSCRTPRSRCTRRWAAPGVWAAQPEIREVDDVEGDGPDYPVLTGDYAGEQARWASRRSRSAARWPSRRRCSPSSTRSSARPARSGRRSRGDGPARDPRRDRRCGEPGSPRCAPHRAGRRCSRPPPSRPSRCRRRPSTRTPTSTPAAARRRGRRRGAWTGRRRWG